MDEGEKQRRRRTPFDQASDVASRLITFLGQRTLLSPLAGLGPIVLTVFGVIFLFAFLTILTQGGVGVGIPGGPTSPSPTPAPIAGGPGIPGGSGAYIAQCTFYGRSGEMKIGNQELAKFVAEVADKVGVPSPVLAGILRIESPSKFSATDTNIFKNDYDDTRSSKNAVGIMQFLPSTFEGIFVQNKDAIQINFNKSAVKIDIEPLTIPPPNDEILRITSIKDSIIMAAYKIKGIKDTTFGSTSNWDENAVKYVAEKYHGACLYDARDPSKGNYCDDLWKSVQTCEFNLFAGPRQFAEAIEQECKEAVLGSKVEKCLSKVPASINNVGEAKRKVQESAIAYTYLQCVGFVQAVIPIVNFPSLNRPATPKAAQENPPPSYIFIPKSDGTIQLGDMPIWHSSAPGHIGYVVNVASDGKFEVVDANWCNNCGKVQVREDRVSNEMLVGWLRRK